MAVGLGRPKMVPVMVRAQPSNPAHRKMFDLPAMESLMAVGALLQGQGLDYAAMQEPIERHGDYRAGMLLQHGNPHAHIAEGSEQAMNRDGLAQLILDKRHVELPDKGIG